MQTSPIVFFLYSAVKESTTLGAPAPTEASSNQSTQVVDEDRASANLDAALHEIRSLPL